MEKEIVMYSRSMGCPFVSIAQRVLEQHQLSYREILINRDEAARRLVLDWTGFESVPTIVVADPGETLPNEQPAPLPAGASPRGVNRGSMITEPSAAQLTDWLCQHGFIE